MANHYQVTYVAKPDGDFEKLFTIDIEADMVELVGGVVTLTRKIQSPYGFDPKDLVPEDEAPPTIQFVETVFVVPLHRLIHIQKVKATN